jgi:mono/diheme cytochrome c family protein
VAAGIVAVAGSAMAAAWLLTVPAYPTTYAASPVHYTTSAIADGARLFTAHCAACHGSDGAGPTVGSAVQAPDLLRHAARHRPGEVYWWIAHGRAGTAMPAFAPPLASEEIWSIVQFLHALSDSAGLAGTDASLAARRVPAPDFNFELPERGQQALLQTDAREDTLFVLYSLPGSLARLRSLASQRHVFAHKGIRVLAMTASASDAQTARAQTPGGESMLGIAAPDVAIAYAMFATRDRVASHAEFLIDRRGYLRVRWLGVPASGDDRDTEILSAAQKLDSERPPPPRSPEHAH